MIPNTTIDRIKETADIVEVVNDFVPLKKKGQNHWACCPFHGEKTPSFSVNDAKQIFKCFGCGEAGDSISFVMKLEGLDYGEALRYLANKYNIEIEEEQMTPEQMEKQDARDSLFIVLNYAKAYFKDKLHNSDEGKSIGLSYFKERGFSEKIIDDFGLGYALEAWEGIKKDAEEKQYNPELLEKAGLVLRKDDRTYDRFRGRVIFPIHNLAGKPIAFGARILKNDKNQPKYINSPETEVYHKSKILYGIYQAKSKIRSEENCYLVEGYTDVISLHQAGIENVVASSGTSLTVDQIKLLKRYTPTITFLFDGDAAGQKAALRGLDLVLEEGVNIKIVLFPDGEDPDSYVRNVGSEVFQKYITEQAEDFITFKAKLYLKDVQNDPLKRAEAVKEIVKSLSAVEDNITRSFYIKECAKLFEISEGIIITEVNKIKLKGHYDRKKDHERQISDDLARVDEVEKKPVKLDANQEIANQEIEIIRLLLNYAEEQINDDNNLTSYMLESLGDVEFHDASCNKIITVIQEHLAKGEIIGGDYFVKHSDDIEVKNMVIDLMAITSKEEESPGWEKHLIYVPTEKEVLPTSATMAILRLKWKNIHLLMEKKQEEIKNATTPEEADKCMKIFIQLKQGEKEIAEILGNVIVK